MEIAMKTAATAGIILILACLIVINAPTHLWSDNKKAAYGLTILASAAVTLVSFTTALWML